MSGNVWEWCQDWKADYPSGSVTDPDGPSFGYIRVGRGGGWGSGAGVCRSAHRFSFISGRRNVYLGFRLAGH
ncbi:MAG: SUMF1/EgtB/PvdO family nonheme iron enzyme [Pseudomonadota bacterium]